MAVSKKDRQDYEEWILEGNEVKNKTPAVLFYHEDWVASTADMTPEEKGYYIDLIAHQNIHGRMSKEYIDRVCPNCPQYVLDKFRTDEDGMLYNERMEIEIMRRNKFQESKVENGKKGGRPKAKENLNKTDRLSESKPNENLPETETETAIETINNKEEIEDIISYLNGKLGTNYRANSKATSKKINARLNEGFTPDDFIAVIDKKCEDWLGDTKMAQYLTPDTLFGTKFEKYLEQARMKKTTGNAFLDMAMGVTI